MPPTQDVPKKPYSLRRLIRIALAAVVTFCALLAFTVFANRDNPSAAPTLGVRELGTAAGGLSPSATPFEGESIVLTLSTEIQGDVLNISGRTNLPNRAILLYKVGQVSAAPMSIDGTLAVLDGGYATQVDISGLPPGTIEVWVGFQTLLIGNERQPEEVIERYGEAGENLHGENVIEVDGSKRVEVRQTVEILP
jgi:hypothetical protein